MFVGEVEVNLFYQINEKNYNKYKRRKSIEVQIVNKNINFINVFWLVRKYGFWYYWGIFDFWF